MQRISKYENVKKIDELRPQAWATPTGGLGSKKRHRRTAEEIDRHYICPHPGCGKSYGYVCAPVRNRSEGSLSQHLKLKHRIGGGGDMESGANAGATGSIGSNLGRQTDQMQSNRSEDSGADAGDNSASCKR